MFGEEFVAPQADITQCPATLVRMGRRDTYTFAHSVWIAFVEGLKNGQIGYTRQHVGHALGAGVAQRIFGAGTAWIDAPELDGNLLWNGLPAR